MILRRRRIIIKGILLCFGVFILRQFMISIPENNLWKLNQNTERFRLERYENYKKTEGQREGRKHILFYIFIQFKLRNLHKLLETRKTNPS